MTIYRKFEVSEKNARKIFEKELAAKNLDLTKVSIASLLEMVKTNYIKIEKEQREKGADEESIKSLVESSKFNFYISNGKFLQEHIEKDIDEKETIITTVLPVFKSGDYQNTGSFEEGIESLLYQVLTKTFERKKEIFYTFYTTDSKEVIKDIFGSKAYIEDIEIDDGSLRQNEIKENINWKSMLKEQASIGSGQSVTWGKTEIEKQRENIINRHLRGVITPEDTLFLKKLKESDSESYDDLLVDILFAPKKEDEVEDILKLRSLRVMTGIDKMWGDYNNLPERFYAVWNGIEGGKNFSQLGMDLINLDFRFMLKKIKEAKEKNSLFYKSEAENIIATPGRFTWENILDYYLKVLKVIPLFNEKEEMNLISLKRYSDRDVSILTGTLKSETLFLLNKLDAENIVDTNKENVEVKDNVALVTQGQVLLSGEDVVANIIIEDISKEDWTKLTEQNEEEYKKNLPKKINVKITNNYLNKYPYVKEFKNLIQDVIVNSNIQLQYNSGYEIRDNITDKTRTKVFMLPYESLTNIEKINLITKTIILNGLNEDTYGLANKAINDLRADPELQEKFLKISDFVSLVNMSYSVRAAHVWGMMRNARNLLLKSPDEKDLILYKMNGFANVKGFSNLTQDIINENPEDMYDFIKFIEENDVFKKGIEELKLINANYHSVIGKRDKRELIVEEFRARNTRIIDCNRGLIKLLSKTEDESKKESIQQKINDTYKWTYKLIDELIAIKEENEYKETWSVTNLLSSNIQEVNNYYEKNFKVQLEIFENMLSFKDEDELNLKRKRINNIFPFDNDSKLKIIGRLILLDNGITERGPEIDKNDWGQLLSKKISWKQDDLGLMTQILTFLNNDKYKVLMTENVLADFAIKTLSLATTNVNSSPEMLVTIKDFLSSNFKNKKFEEEFFKLFHFTEGRHKKKVRDTFEKVGLTEKIEDFVIENKTLEQAISLIGSTEKLYEYYKEPSRLALIKKTIKYAETINDPEISYSGQSSLNMNHLNILKGMGLINEVEYRNAQQIYALEQGNFHYSAINPTEKHNRIFLNEKLDDVRDVLLTKKFRTDKALNFLMHTLKQFSTDLMEEDSLIERVSYLLDAIQNINPSVNIYEQGKSVILDIYKLFGKEKYAVLSTMLDISGDSLGVSLNKVKFSNMLTEDIKIVKKRKI